MEFSGNKAALVLCAVSPCLLSSALLPVIFPVSIVEDSLLLIEVITLPLRDAIDPGTVVKVSVRIRQFPLCMKLTVGEVAFIGATISVCELIDTVQPSIFANRHTYPLATLCQLVLVEPLAMI